MLCHRMLAEHLSQTFLAACSLATTLLFCCPDRAWPRYRPVRELDRGILRGPARRTLQFEDVIRRDFPRCYTISAASRQKLISSYFIAISPALYAPGPDFLINAMTRTTCEPYWLTEAQSPIDCEDRSRTSLHSWAPAQQPSLKSAASTGTGSSPGKSSRAPCPI